MKVNRIVKVTVHEFASLKVACCESVILGCAEWDGMARARRWLASSLLRLMGFAEGCGLVKFTGEEQEGKIGANNGGL